MQVYTFFATEQQYSTKTAIQVATIDRHDNDDLMIHSTEVSTAANHRKLSSLSTSLPATSYFRKINVDNKANWSGRNRNLLAPCEMLVGVSVSINDY